MKSKMTLVAALAVCALAVSSSRADNQDASASSKTAVEKKATSKRVVDKKAAETRTRTEQTGEPHGTRLITGSYIPQKYDKNGPYPNSTQPTSVYDRRDLEKNGYYDIGTSLKRTDPSIRVPGTY